MRKLKLVVSDLHLGVGKFHSAGEINQLEEFYYDERFAEFLNYYSTGEYQEAEVELILNGDILNFLQVDYRGHFLSVITESISLEKLKNIVGGHPVFFDALRKFSKLPNHSVVYIVGNHDQCMLWPATRTYFSESVGTEVKFRNIVYFFDGVHIEHGHMHEVANRLDPKKFFLKKDVPEPILNLPLGSHFFVDFVLKVKMENPYIDKVRPFTALIRWGLFFNTMFTLKTLGKLIGYFISRIFGSEGSKYRWPMRRLFQIVTERAIFPDLTTAAKKVL
ncbi:MAG: metallophosphoesterase, partial [Bdellovibrionales bacterium]|nr:metallophosphoesterase [Bdellovibrionales bacterium]